MKTFRTIATAVSTAVAAAALTACAGLATVESNVSSFSQWPAGRAPATYAFDRLPSQQANGQQAQLLEGSARTAIERAGFVPAAEGAVPDVRIQLGAHVGNDPRFLFDDPYWLAVGPYNRRIYGPFYGPSQVYDAYGADYGQSHSDRQVGLLIRDQRSGASLYEARASSRDNAVGPATLLPALFSAALTDFPTGSSTNPHRIVVVAAGD